MKVMTKLAIGAAVVLLIGAGLQPAQAACPPPGFQIVFAGAYVISNPNWGGVGGNGSCYGGFGCYDSESGPPVSANLDGFFWGQTAGDETFGAGVDNGLWPVKDPNNANAWVKARSAVFDSLYHYPAFISVEDGSGYGSLAGYELNWAASNLIDGCVGDINPGTRNQCTCFLMTDEWNGQGYYAIMSKHADTVGDFIFNEAAGTIYRLAPTPRPEVISSSADSATATVTFNISVPTPTGGDYRDSLCDCGFGFRVFAAVMPEGGMPPSSREACTERALFDATGSNLRYTDAGFAAACRTAGFQWIPATDLSGAAQPVTPFGAARATSGVSVDCGDPGLGYDVYLATALGANEGNGGVQLAGVSESSFQVKCGSYTLAEPNRPERPSATPGRSGETPRGRDNNRGNRER